MVLYSPKTETLFNRGDNFEVTDKFRKPEFGLVKDWTFYERVGCGHAHRPASL